MENPQHKKSVLKHLPPAEALHAELAMIERFADPACALVLEFWSTDTCLVAPRSLSRHKHYEALCAQMSGNGWPVHVRRTGGEVTPQGPGTLNVSLAFATDPNECPSIHGVYETFCDPLVGLFSALGCPACTQSVPGSFCDGEFNVASAGLKIAGTAQRWTRVRSTRERRQIVFAHALILVKADIAAGVCAINQLYAAAGIDRHIDPTVHANLCDQVAPSFIDLNCTDVAQWLDTRYRDCFEPLVG